MNRINASVRRFIDVEASVDNEIGETDEDEDADLQDGFIDNTADEVQEVHIPLRPAGEVREEDTDHPYDQLLASAYYRARTAAGPNYLLHHHLNTATIIGHPGENEHPLWRVKCKIGSEEYIIAYLLHAAEPLHELRSAFTRGSIRGYVYLECNMNVHLRELLEKTPGITKHTYRGLTLQIIPSTDYVDLLRMKNLSSVTTVDTWVLIKRGIYKGDIGLVVATETWGVHVLLLPRVSYQRPDKKQKRKASTLKDPPKLFDAVEFETLSSQTLNSLGDHTYKLGDLHFEYGLICRPYDYFSISPQVSDIPWNYFTMFNMSMHPNVIASPPPRPSEWLFMEGETVIVCSSRKRGILISVEAKYVELEITSEGIHRFSWRDIRKYIASGDYVTITSGSYLGKTGWVTDVDNETASIFIDKTDENADSLTSTPSSELVDVHVNCLRVIESPFRFSSQKSNEPAPHDQRRFHPWCNTEVIISKYGHARKGQTARILDVISNPSESTGLMLVVQILRFDPANPFPKVTVSCNDVVQYPSRKDLFTFFNSEHAVNSTQQQPISIVNSDDCATPMPTASSSTPAWDPSSRTPLNPSSSLTPPRANNVPTDLPIRDHVLWHTDFLNVRLNIMASGDPNGNAERQATLIMVDGRFSMRYKIQRATFTIQPEFVLPKHPNPARDNGLVIVIKGEHRGKFLRRIYHRGRGESAVMIAAVVTRVDGAQDIITDERLELTRDYLCTVDEETGSRNRNKNIMEKIRTAYRQTHHS